MDTSLKAFADFERAGWEDASIVANYDDHLAVVTAQSIAALLDEARVRAGLRVLDVATGGGYAAEAAFQRGADAIGIDFSARQVSLARKRHPTLQFEQADAESLPFEPATFDAVVSAFGICHLPNPDLALREAHRVLKTGGRVAFSVWDVPERAVGIGAVYTAIRAHGSMDVGLPVGPNFFLFSDAEQSIRALRAAGFDSPTVHSAPQIWRLDDPDSMFDRIAGSSVRAGITLRSQTAAARAAIRATLREIVSKYKLGAHFEVPMPAIIASAIKPKS
jgi:ubiquinone/menaquinone biosynthesis C-methylase UbiE